MLTFLYQSGAGMRMQKLLWGWGICAAALWAGPALAVNKCVDAQGKVSYTDGPCPAGARGNSVDLLPPPSREDQQEAVRRGQAWRDEARALDARQDAELAARRRAAEQAEAQEARQAARAAAQAQQDESLTPRYYYPVPVPGYPQRPVPQPPVVRKPEGPTPMGKVNGAGFRRQD